MAHETKPFEDRFCVVLPTYNNGTTLGKVISEILAVTSHLIVINDGSTDQTEEILRNLNVRYLSHPVNRGKGSALKTGFRYAIDHGYEYAITLDSDGQHHPAEIPDFIRTISESGEALLIGQRNMDQASVPSRSNFGRKFSNFWFLVETGIALDDTQSGFRCYPLRAIRHMKFFTPRFEFEIESIVRIAWKGVRVAGIPVSVTYFTGDERVSHFRPVKDFLRISLLNSVLVILGLLWFRPAAYFRGKTLKNILFNPAESVSLRAFSVGFGIFMGIIPIWGFQLVAAIAIAHLLKLNKALVIIFANISIPPMIPLILYLSVLCGQMWIRDPVHLGYDMAVNLETMKPLFLQYIAGSITLALISGIAVGSITYLIVKHAQGRTR